MANKSFIVKVKKPGITLFEGEAISLTSVNEKGIFDILPYHANFISVIKDKIVIKDVTGTERKIEIEKGILRFTGNNVTVFLGIETLQTDRL